jgi:transporter family-2 protein
MVVLLMLTAVGMGSVLATQVGVNGRLRVRTGDPVYAALISSTIAALSLLIYSVVVVREPWPAVVRLTSAPWWIWTGGLMGALYVVMSLVLVSRLGGAALFGSIVLGQMLAAITMDHFGLLGLQRHEVNLWRVFGALLLVAGVVLIRRH